MVIDHSGLWAPRAWEQLQKAGLTPVAGVKAGIAEWREAGLPVQTLEMQLEQERLQQEREQMEEEE